MGETPASEYNFYRAARAREEHLTHTLIEVYPLPDQPRTIPLSIALDSAVTVAAGLYDEVSELDVLSPKRSGDSRNAHSILLLLLTRGKVPADEIGKELAYRSAAGLSRAVSAADEEAEFRLKNLFEIAQVKYKREIDRRLAERDLASEQALFTGYRGGEQEAVDALDRRYQPILSKAVERLGGDAPADISDRAYAIYQSVIEAVPPEEVGDFEKRLIKALSVGLTTCVEEHRRELERRVLQSQIEGSITSLDVGAYRKQIKRLEFELGDQKPTSRLDPAVTEAIVAGALDYLKKRLDAPDGRLKGFDKAPPERREVIARELTDIFRTNLRRRIDVSLILQERAITPHNLTNLTDEQFRQFLSLSIDEAASVAERRVGRHKR